MQEVDPITLRREEFSGPIEERVDKLIFYAVRGAESHTHLQRRQNALSDRLAQLENAERLRQVAEAREDERDKRLADKLEDMTTAIKEVGDEVDKIKNLGWWALRIFVAAFLLAAANAILKGGLSAYL